MDEQTLWLCAQINFAQMPLLEGFPGEGILQFFLSDFDYDGGFDLYSKEDGTIQGNWRIFYYPTVDESVTEEECLARMPDSWEDKAGLWRTPDRPLKMLFLPADQEGINYEDFRFTALFAAALTTRLPDEDPKEFMPYELDDNTSEEWEALNKIRKQMKQGGCKTGGYPRYCQCDPRENPYQGMTEEMLKKYNIPPEAVQRALERPVWDSLLFQLDDETFTYPAGDIGEMDINLNGGILNFLIRSEDLRNRDFSHVSPLNVVHYGDFKLYDNYADEDIYEELPILSTLFEKEDEIHLYSRAKRSTATQPTVANSKQRFFGVLQVPATYSCI